MLGWAKRLLPLMLLACVDSALGQQSQPLLGLGDAVVTGFSGTVTAKPAGKKSAADLTFINADGPSLRIVDVSRPGYVWDGRFLPAAKPFSVAAKDVGQVFGVALDDAPLPNIYVAATSVFGLNIVSRARDGSYGRRKKGGPGTGWMRGQFGLELQGGPGGIYKIDGQTGAVTLFANVTLDGVPNPGPALGNLAFDAAHQQLFVSDLYTGMIHRFALDGRDLGHFDHGATARPAAKLPPIAFDPKTRPNIASDRFDSEKPDTWGLAPLPRRVWGLAVHEGRLYYSVAAGPQIWSVGIAADGSFAADPRWELDVPAQAGPLPISDIAFSQKGAMILAQRALVAGAYDYSAFTRPGDPAVFRMWLKGPNDPPSPGRWKPLPEEYAVGFAGSYRNTNGGVALGYGYGQDGALNTNGCEASLWTTGQSLRNAPALRDKLQPGGEMVVHGLQGSPSSPVREINAPPWTSYFVDYDDAFGDPQATGHLGSVRIYTKPCAAPAAYYGPGYAAAAPYLIIPPAGCRPNCPPGGTPVDIGIAKVGEVNVDNPDGPYNFTVGVRNLGGAITTSVPLSFTDVVPAGMTFTNVTWSAEWNCAPIPPLSGGATLTCNYVGNFPIAAGQAMGWVTIIADGGEGPYTNCAELGIDNSLQDTDQTNNRACVTVEKKKGNVTVVKEIINLTDPQISTTGLQFPVTLTCGGTSSNLNLTDGLPQTIGGIPFNTTCSIIETSQPLPSGNCPAGQTLTWAPQTYVPPSGSAQVVSGTTITLKVQNTLGCKPNDGDGYVLVKKEVVPHMGLPTPPTMTFPVNVTCNGNTTTLYLSSDGTPQSVGGLAVGTSCQIDEPASTNNACPQGMTTVWGTTNYSPSNSANAAMPGPTVTVINSYDCQQGGGELLFVKNVVYLGPLILPDQSYPVNVTCGTSVTLNLLNGVTQTAFGSVPYNSQCTFNEPTPPVPSGACPPGWIGTWATTYSDPSPITINQITKTVTVTNTLTCAKGDDGGGGSLAVTKTIVKWGEPQVTGSFPVTVTCGSQVNTLQLTEGVAQTVSGIPLNTSCTLNEGAFPTATCPGFSTPAWGPVTYSPNPVTVTGPNTPATVQNVLSCERGGNITVTKHVTNNTQADLSGLSFPVAVTCGSGGGSVTHTVTVADGGSQYIHNLPANLPCTPVETLPSPPAGGCPADQVPTWGPITYNPPSVTTVAGQGPTLTVENVLNCEPTKSSISKPPVQCKPPLVANDKGECGCKAGLTLRGGKCVEVVTCRAPAKLNSRGTGCNCPKGMTLKGNTCEEERKTPRVTPGDVIRVLPGIIPGIGGHGGGRSGGDSGGGGKR